MVKDPGEEFCRQLFLYGGHVTQTRCILPPYRSSQVGEEQLTAMSIINNVVWITAAVEEASFVARMGTAQLPHFPQTPPPAPLLHPQEAAPASGNAVRAPKGRERAPDGTAGGIRG